MRKLQLVLGIASFVLAIIVFLFAEGARSIYSGSFFVLIGVLLLLNARRGRRETAE